MRLDGSLRALCVAGALGIALAGAPDPARAADPSDESLRTLADLVLNGVREQIADCEGRPRVLASASPGTGTLATGRPPLRWNAQLGEAASRHGEQMARTRLFDHVGTDGTTVRERVDATGYRWQVIGENLAAGHSRLEEAVVGWLRSRSHCAALLDPRFTEFGLARTDSTSPNDAYGTYWTLVLGKPR
jgi:hypothetical protein